MERTINECLDKLANCCQYSGDFSALEQVRSFIREAQAASTNTDSPKLPRVECAAAQKAMEIAPSASANTGMDAIALIRSAVLDCPLELRLKICETLNEYEVAQQHHA